MKERFFSGSYDTYCVCECAKREEYFSLCNKIQDLLKIPEKRLEEIKDKEKIKKLEEELKRLKNKKKVQ